MNKFDEVYNRIITEWNEENKLVSEGIFRKAAGLLRTKKGKHKMMKDSIIKWMNGNKFSPNGEENKYIGKLPNGFTIKFTFRKSQWFDDESSEIDYAVYLKNEEGADMALDRNGTIDYGYSENDIKKELTSKLKLALSKDEAKAAFTTKKASDKKRAKEAAEAKKAADAEKAKADKEAALKAKADELSE